MFKVAEKKQEIAKERLTPNRELKPITQEQRMEMLKINGLLKIKNK